MTVCRLLGGQIDSHVWAPGQLMQAPAAGEPLQAAAAAIPELDLGHDASQPLDNVSDKDLAGARLRRHPGRHVDSYPNRPSSRDETSPALRPRRRVRAWSGRRWLCFSCADWMAQAHEIALRTELNVTRKPSPVVCTSRPPCAVSCFRTSWSCLFRIARASLSPRRAVSSVEPTISVKSTTSRPVLLTASATRVAGRCRLDGRTEDPSTASLLR